MRLRRFIRRPSPALGVALVALFVSLGGVGYAASQVPANSVGTSQIRNNAVSYQKIEPNSVGKVRLADGGVVNSKLANDSVSYKKIQAQAVGKVRANLNQLQARISTTCSTGTAIGAVDNNGKVTCNTTQPAEFGASNTNPVPLTSTAATVASVNLPAGSTYLAFANPTITTTSGSGNSVTCTLTVGTTTQSRTVTFNAANVTQSIPLQLAGAAGTASVACTTTAPTSTTNASTSLNALQTSSNS